MTELFLDLAGRPEATKSLRLQAALRDAIRTGRIRTGDRLPSSRALANELGWARNVIVDAYDQLNVEGYLVARAGDGTRVAPRPTKPDVGDRQAVESDVAERGDPRPRINLQPGLPDLVAFPVREWRRALNTALTTIPVAELGYADGRGATALRVAIAAHLARTRAIGAEPENVLITTGVSASLRLLVAELASGGRPVRVAVEDPGAYTQWDALGAAGGVVVPVGVDGEGIDVGRLDEVDADLVVVTPAHQYPLGGVLSPGRRRRLIEWARARDGRLVVEDDYDAEFRYDRRPVGAIAGIAPDVTVHTGSVSKSLAPGLRLGWLHLPRSVVECVGTRLRHEFVGPDAIQQHALADLLVTGAYDRIVRSKRRLYRKRRQAMIDALASVPEATAIGAAGGLHLTILLPSVVDDQTVSRMLLDGGIDVPALSRYRLTPGRAGLVASFASINDASALDFARSLGQTLRSLR